MTKLWSWSFRGQLPLRPSSPCSQASSWQSLLSAAFGWTCCSQGLGQHSSPCLCICLLPSAGQAGCSPQTGPGSTQRGGRGAGRQAAGERCRGEVLPVPGPGASRTQLPNAHLCSTEHAPFVGTGRTPGTAVKLKGLFPARGPALPPEGLSASRPVPPAPLQGQRTLMGGARRSVCTPRCVRPPSR